VLYACEWLSRYSVLSNLLWYTFLVYVLFIIPKIYCKNFFHQKLRKHNVRFGIKSVQPRKIGWQRDVNKRASITHGECAHARVLGKKWSNFQVSTITRNMRNIKRYVHAGNLAGMSNASSSTLALISLKGLRRTNFRGHANKPSV